MYKTVLRVAEKYFAIRNLHLDPTSRYRLVVISLIKYRFSMITVTNT